MKKCYLGIDIGSISTKGVIIDNNKNIITSDYIYTEGNPILSVKKLIKKLYSNLDTTKYKIVNIGTTGTYRKIIGTMLETTIIKNEITAHSIGAISLNYNINTIFDISKYNIKIITINKNIIEDYNITRINIDKQDNLEKYLNKITRKIDIKKNISVQGGNSKNKIIVNRIKRILNNDIIVDNNSHLMGALGVAILALNSGIEKEFNFNIQNIKFEIKNIECKKCVNNCEMICIYKDNKIIKFWGNKCENESIELEINNIYN